MSPREFHSIVRVWLKSLIVDHGFVFSRSSKDFRRVTGQGFQEIGVSLLTNFRYDFAFHHSIRIDRVVEVSQHYLNIDRNRIPNTVIAIVLLSDFDLPRDLPRSFSGNGFLHASSELELQGALERLRPVYLNQVIPFLDGRQTVESVHDLFSRGIGHLRHEGAVLAITTAHLAGAPGFTEIVERYRKLIPKTLPFQEARLRFEAAAKQLLSGAVTR